MQIGRRAARWQTTGIAAATALALAVLVGSAVTAPAATGAVQAGRPMADLPPDAAYPPVDCAAGPRAPGWLRTENARRGSAWTQPKTVVRGRKVAVPAPVVGYASQSSAVCGEGVSVSLSAPAGQPGGVRLAAYRLGWYHGTGSRLVWQSSAFKPGPQPVPGRDRATRLIEPTWSTTVRLPVTADWPPGMYALVPVRGTAQAGPIIPLVVRDDAGSEPVLFMASTLTWQAYNSWGGWSLYAGPSGNYAQRAADRARVVSLNRPLAGAGYDQFQNMDLPVVRWVESLGIDIAYTTDVAIDSWPSQLLRHAELLVGGHSEYWTTRMYDAAEAATAAGMNVALLGANNLWWHARLAADGTREAVYRVAAEDPMAAVDPAETTVLWRQDPLSRDASVITGESHAAIEVRGGLQLLSPPAWFVAGTSLRSGSVLPGAVGNEADGYSPLADHPQSVQVLAAGVLTGSYGPVSVSTIYAVLDSGAAVFSAGTTDWACELGSGCPDRGATTATRTAVRALTRNVVLALADPNTGRLHPAVPVLPPPVAEARRTLARGAVGTYGAVTPVPGKV